MSLARIASYVITIFLLSFSLVGGCGGGGSGSDNEEDINIPEILCNMPSLTSNFSDVGYFFVDDINSVLIGVTSTGEEVIIVLSDIPDSGVQLGLLADTISANACDIFAGVFNTDGDFNFEDEEVLVGSGECLRLNDGNDFRINDFVLDGIPFGTNLTGQCFEALNIANANIKEMTVAAQRLELKSFDQQKTNVYGENILDLFENTLSN